MDEIHRFNKAQQDFLLPYVETGVLTLIGATTENPSFEIISALLSRSRVYVLNRLDENDLVKIILQLLIYINFQCVKNARRINFRRIREKESRRDECTWRSSTSG